MTTPMPMLARRWLPAGAVAVALPAAVCLAQVQQPYPPPRPPPAAKAAPAQPREAGGDAALRQRVEQLEEQLVDMQVVIGTLESLAKGATAPVAAGGRPSTGVAATLSGADAGRLDALETQIRAMAAQLEQMQGQIRALGGRGALTPQAANDYPVPPRTGRAPEPPVADRTGFGAVTVSPDSASEPTDPVPQESPRFGAPVPQESQRFGAPVAAGEAEEPSPKQLYETAYGYLLQRDYGAAEAAFDAFLKRHPNDPLAGNAQYWLGESLYVRGQYRAAAGAFLKGYQSYSHSAKAPESLLKLAMSLQRLGQKDAACSSYGELSTKFPNAPPHVKASAQLERQRAGC